MRKDHIIKELKAYFDIRELVGKSTYKKYGERAWIFLDYRLLWFLLIIRVELNSSITVNNWHIGGKFSQRGLRTNVQQIFKYFFKIRRLYLSGHVMGKAVDFDVKGLEADEVRMWMAQNKDLFPFKIRVEESKDGEPITWNHVDVFTDPELPNIYFFET